MPVSAIINTGEGNGDEQRGNPLEDLTDTNDMNVLYSEYRHPYPFYHQRRLVEFGGVAMFPSVINKF